MANNSDYTKPRTRLHELLPDVFQSDANQSVFENAFNRFLTKNETTRVAGYVGEGNPAAITKRQIREPTLHRQAFQLQPIMTAKIGTTEHMSSWKDLENEIERLGISMDRFSQWGSVLQFNWIPPVDLDKIINFQDYYWYDEDAPNSRPDYITIKSRCTTASAYVNFWNKVVTEYGSTVAIADILPTTDPFPTYNLVQVSGNVFTFTGDLRDQITDGQRFNITGTTSNDGTWIVDAAPTYSQTTNRSAIVVTGTPTNESSLGAVIGVGEFPRYNRVIVTGDYSRLFEPGFQLYIKASLNPELNGEVVEVVDSFFSDVTGLTTLTITPYVTDDTVSGVISLDDPLALALLERDCQCTGTFGWDQTQWDDNPENPLWASEAFPDSNLPGEAEIHASLIARISSTSSPLAAPNSGAGKEPAGTALAPVSGGAAVPPLWYDTSTDIFWQYSGDLVWNGSNAYTGGTWVQVTENFSEMLRNTTGTALWDESVACDRGSQIPSSDQWISNNKWLHKTDVPNFTIAKRAEFPIIEYFANLELNEWTYTGYNWRYRAATYATWGDTDLQPGMIELQPLTTYTMQSGNTIIRLDPSYGDQTLWFSPGKKFRANNFTSVLEVEKSWFATSGASTAYYTFIELTSAAALVSPTNYLFPFFTSNDDLWEGYDIHWVFSSTINTVPVNHQPLNPYITINATGIYVAEGSNYDYTTSNYAKEYRVQIAAPVDTFYTRFKLTGGLGLEQKALLGFDDIRVYVNNIRQYGTYFELSELEYEGTGNATYVYGIEFISGYGVRSVGDTVRIEVGEASSNDFGLHAVSVCTNENNLAEKSTISLIKYRKVEQVKDNINRYPLFDLYNVDGSTAHIASPIFAYQSSPDAQVQTELGIRLVLDTTIKDYGFEQFLFNEDVKKLYAYRDFSNQQSSHWVNTATQQVFVWDQYRWSPTQELSNGLDNFIVTPAYGPEKPSNTDLVGQLAGYLWFDTTNGVLKQRILSGNSDASWTTITDAVISDNDHTLQTIWRKGENNEQYVPAKVDWVARSFDEYESQRTLYEREYAEELVLQGTNTNDAYDAAHAAWLNSQKNEHSVDGEWIGDWEIPDPLYFNNQHENKKTITYRELLTHFNSIINSQPKIPGFNGPRASMYHLIPPEDINYGLGGKIKEYNDGYDTFLSSIFVDTVTPLTLFQSARDQYESLLNNLRELYRRSLIPLMINTTPESLVNQSEFISNYVLSEVEENDNLSSIYGDTTTFTEGADGNPDVGLRNWIITLPYLGLVPRTRPIRIYDEAASLDLVLHHDGHYAQYDVSPSTVEGVCRAVVAWPDARNGTDTFGRASTQTPPDTISAFESAFATTIVDREGVYWYHTSPTPRAMYRFSVVSSGTVEPPTTTADGALWLDLATNTLRVKNGVSWDAVTTVGDGVITSAWTQVNFVGMLNDLIVETETLLFNNAPEEFNPPYVFNDVRNLDAVLYDEYLEQAFLDHVAEQRITAPYANAEYDATDPYTWNYKYSTLAPGYEIVQADESLQAFVVPGNPLLTGAFVEGNYLYVKNDPINEGAWVITNNGASPPVSASYDPGLDRTTVYVAGSKLVKNSTNGLLFATSSSTIFPCTTNTGAESGGYWKDLYNKFYGTPYPHLEPWVLQGFVSKPDWWDDEYANDDPGTYGDRKWKYLHSTETGMWANIKNGIIPDGRTYPNGVVSNAAQIAAGMLKVPQLKLYNYFSVNIGDTTLTSTAGHTYAPDELLPPYWQAAANPDPVAVRSLFSSLSNVIAPAADFAFGDAGPIEWEWRASSQFDYDQLKASFRLDPIRCITHTFGKNFIYLGGLQIDRDTNNTFCHCRTSFHGDIVNNSLYQINGSNQWYVNFNRYVGYDTNYSNFRSEWTQWSAPLMYQFSSFVDTQSFILGHRIIDITPFDWRIASKRSPGVEDFWYDAFKVTVLDAPPPILRYDNEKQWVFELTTNVPTSRTISYYGVRNYQFTVDTTTNTCSLYTYPIDSASSIDDRVYIKGDQTDTIEIGTEFDISGSPSNDGSYVVEHVAYDASTDRTIIDVNSLPSATAGGVIKLVYRTMPWATGDRVYLTTSELLPSPILNETEYFIIVIDNTTFKLARTSSDALNNVPITLTTAGRGNHFVGQLNSTFVALDGATTTNNWKHYQVDQDTVLTLSTPTEVKGVQTIIDFIDGYEVYQYDQGWRINDSGLFKDYDNPSRVVSWQLELERFINYIYGIRTQRQYPPSTTFDVSIDETTSTFTFNQDGAQFVTGDPVMVLADNYLYPSPLLANIKYYIIRDTVSTFKLAVSKADADKGIYITFGGSPSASEYSLKLYPAKLARGGLVTFEMNPIRNGIWFRPERGIVSNLITGPTEDIRSSQLVFDQYGRALGRNSVQVLRQDKQTMISVAEGVTNDVNYSSNPYDNLHLGGIHLFVDAYEHVLVLNNYTTENQLVYDPFVGLNVTKYELQYRRQEDFTQRPNVGGYYYITNNNQDAQLKRNIEASIEDLRMLYDTYTAPETETLIAESRKMLGYEGVRDYFNNLNLGPKSQFVYWKGMIQQKGSVNAIKAFINSRRFLDAKVDEFWAVKLADFGSAAEKEYPAIYLTTKDARSNELRLEFAIDEDLCIPGYAMNVYDQMPCGYAFPEDGAPVLIGADGFTPVLLSDEERWYEQPDQVATLQNNGETLYFTLKPNGTVPITFASSEPCVAGPAYSECLYFNPDDINDVLTSEQLKPENLKHNQGVVYRDMSASPYGNMTFYRWNSGSQSWDHHGAWSVGDRSTVRHGLSSDSVEITVDLYDNGVSAGGCRITEYGATYTQAECILTGFDPPTRVITSANGVIPYIPFADSIQVFKQQNSQIAQVIEYTGPGPLETLAKIVVEGDVSATVRVGSKIAIENEFHVTILEVTVDAIDVATTTAGSPPSDFVMTTLTLRDKLRNTPALPISSLRYVSTGRLLVSGVDYAETLNPSGELLSSSLQFPIKLVATDTIKIVYGTATLSSDLHYTVINSDVVRFEFPEILGGVTFGGSPDVTGFLQNVKIWGMIQDDTSQDPAKIIDVQANVVVTPVQLWDPARNLHYYLAANSIGLYKDVDPARYTNTELTFQVVDLPSAPSEGGGEPTGPAVPPTPPPPPPPPPPPDDVTPEPPVDPIEASLAASLSALEGLVVESVIPNNVVTYAYAAVTFGIDGNIETSATITTPSVSTPITVLGPWLTGGGTRANYELWAEKVSEYISHPVANSTPAAISSLPSSGYNQWLPMSGSTDKAFYALADFDHPTQALEAVVQVKFKIRSAATGNILAQMTTPVTIRAYNAAP